MVPLFSFIDTTSVRQRIVFLVRDYSAYLEKPFRFLSLNLKQAQRQYKEEDYIKKPFQILIPEIMAM